MVASFTDAWIETNLRRISKDNRREVASFTDAWIETNSVIDYICLPAGRIFYRCVDWNTGTPEAAPGGNVASFTDAWIETFNPYKPYANADVASFTDAWIETLSPNAHANCTTSHLLQMRGLKPIFARMVHGQSMSHLLQMRGLKLNGKKTYNRWISRIFYRCVDWNLRLKYLKLGLVRRIFYRCVDWNRVEIFKKKYGDSRIFYRCVDWNKSLNSCQLLKVSHLLQMRGLKLDGELQYYTDELSHLLQMRGLKPESKK